MGNWRTVRIVGTCDYRETGKLRKALVMDFEEFHCLMQASGLCGIPDWAKEEFDVVGNLAERDYDPEDVAKTLKEIVKTVPSLNLKLHCGDDRESKKCVATITVKDGKVDLGKPEVEEIPEISQDQFDKNFLKAMLR